MDLFIELFIEPDSGGESLANCISGIPVASWKVQRAA